MNYTTLIRFAPLVTLERLNDPLWRRPGRTAFDHGALSFFPGKTSVPLLVNHDPEREIGVVRELTRFMDTDGPWLAALCTVTDKPEWLKRGTRASFGYKCGRTSTFDRDVLRKGWVTEVSVLTAGHEPLEPGARVLTLREDANPILPVAPAGATVIAGNGQIIRRPVGQVLAVR